MKICIVSNDKRYIELNKILKERGYDSCIKNYNESETCDVLILSLRKELSDTALKELLSRQDAQTLVLSGYTDKIKEYFNGRAIDYSGNETFLRENAHLTAEATISLLHSVLQGSVKNLHILVCGYGRIGKELCHILFSLGARLKVYARREKIQAQIKADGYDLATLEDSINCDLVINTVPSNIFTRELLDRIPINTRLIELASPPGGFEIKERVVSGAGLPGRILPISSAKIIYNAIEPLFRSRGSYT